MAAAVDLLDAANLTPQNLRVLWEADTLQARMIAFWQAISLSFDDQIPDDHPVINWISIIAAQAPSILPFADTMNPGVTPWPGGTIETFTNAVDYIYRLCKFAFYYTLISGAQKTVILNAYNAQFA